MESNYLAETENLCNASIGYADLVIVKLVF